MSIQTAVDHTAINHPVMIDVQGLSKRFTLHNQRGLSLPVFQDIAFQARAGECTVLYGESGSGKSTLLRTLYGNYLASEGAVLLWHQQAWVDLTTASPQQILRLRRDSLGYVSQFLRVIPRIGALDLVMQPLLERQFSEEEARERAITLLHRLHIPERLWNLPPSTFSGGEQQRINIARGFIVDYPILLLDEPTASLDAKNAAVVVELIREALSRGTCVVGIFHDADIRDQVATRIFHVGVDVDKAQSTSATPTIPGGDTAVKHTSFTTSATATKDSTEPAL